jgi:hypothetical protein
MSRPAVGPTQPPVQWEPGILFPGLKRGWSLTLTHHLIYCRGQEWVGAIHPLPQAPSWRVVGQLWLCCFINRHTLREVLLTETSNIHMIRNCSKCLLDPETGYPETFFVVFLITSRKMPGQYLKIRSPVPFQFIIHLSLFHSTLCSLSYWKSIV